MMVYPVNSIIFKIGTKGRASDEQDMAVVRDMEKFEISFDSGVQEWSALDQDGWSRRLMTAKSMTAALAGKRNYGDAGNDYVAGLAYQNGGDATSVLHITFPDGSRLVMPCVVNVEESDGGNADDVAALSFKCMSDGKPVYTRA